MSNIEKVYVLQHSYDYGEHNEYTEVKFIGVYSSKEKADAAIKRLINIEGFNRFSETCFNIDIYTLDEDNWTEGFISYEG